MCYYIPPETSGNPLTGDHPKEGVTAPVREPPISFKRTGPDLDKPHAIAHLEDEEVKMPRCEKTGPSDDYTAETEDNPRDTGTGLSGLDSETPHDCGFVPGDDVSDLEPHLGGENECHPETRNPAPL